MNLMRRVPFFMAMLFVLAACGEDVETAPGASGTAAPGNPAGGGAGLIPPILMEVAPFAGMIRVSWQYKSPCDEIEGERRTPTTEFVPVFTAPGTDTATIDPDAYENITYSYRLRCKRGDAYSEYSNEKIGNPTDG